MISDATRDDDATLAQLTAPGAPFELEHVNIDGRTAPVYRHAFKNLPALLNAGRSHGEAIFLVYQGEHWSFDRFYQEVDALVAWMHTQGVKPGDRVAIAMRNRPEWGVAFAAAALLGAMPAPINSFGSGEELREAIAGVSPALVCCDTDRLQRLEEGGGSAPCLVLRVGPETEAASAVETHAYEQAVKTSPDRSLEADPEPGEAALILFTSGASSRPKGVVSSHRAACQAVTNREFISAYSVTSSPGLLDKLMAAGNEPVSLLVFPLFHVSALLYQLLTSIKSGQKMVIMYRWNSRDALELMRSHKITTFSGAPAMARQILNEEAFSDPEIKGRLSGFGFGGAGVPDNLLERVLNELPDAMLGAGFGMTETNGVGSGISGDLYRSHPKSSGLVSPLMEIRIEGASDQHQPAGEPGEILFRGAPVMKEYWRNPEGTAAALDDGWLHTGDLGYMDEEGFLYVVDRLKDIINRSGEIIAAAEVESCLMKHPAVTEAAVFSVPDEVTTEAVAAVVSVSATERPDAVELQRHVANCLARYKVPRDIEVREEPLTRNPTGKLVKPQIKREFLDHHGAG